VPTVAYYTHADFDLHEQGPHHPERPDRTKILNARLAESDLWQRLDHREPPVAPVEMLYEVHERSYVDSVQYICEQGGGLVDNVDTGTIPESFRIARRAVGSVAAAVDAVISDSVDSAFSAVRPPGHHAMPNRAMGFCLFNNVAIAARYARRTYGIDRILIVDWDFHHGNGTQEAFYRDGSVLFFSVHCSPAYPYSGYEYQLGEDAGAGLTINAPLPPGSGRREYSDAMNDVLRPAAKRFNPELVLVSAGFDAHRADPLSQMRLDEEDFGRFTDVVREIADESADGRIVSVLEGGYNVNSLASSAEEHIRRLLD
jgi:acetoin utilization deacetylase AcuC-like enzyme